MRKYLDLRANLALGLAFIFLVNSLGPLPAYARNVETPFMASHTSPFMASHTSPFMASLPAPGTMVPLSPEFNPPILKGIKVHPDNPFRFDFILDTGDSFPKNMSFPNASVGNPQQEQLKQESIKLIKYFLASLTIPENDLWVNLSPYEKNRIVPQSFGLTEMGRDLLAEDYMLKQITASLIYPEGETGKKFWKRIYEEAAKKFGTTNIPVNTFNKVWIVPEKAVVYENAKNGTAYVVESKLKVMLEEDYLSIKKHTVETPFMASHTSNNVNSLASNIVREIVIPELTKEVNEGRNFYQLRQVYNSLILAYWYKKKIKDSILVQVYADKKKVVGVGYTSTVIPAKAGPQAGHSQELGIHNKNDVEAIYQRYLQAFKKGVYNYIKEDADPLSRETIPRKYFSGGTSLQLDNVFKRTIDGAMVNPGKDPSRYIEEGVMFNQAMALKAAPRIQHRVELPSIFIKRMKDILNKTTIQARIFDRKEKKWVPIKVRLMRSKDIGKLHPSFNAFKINDWLKFKDDIIVLVAESPRGIEGFVVFGVPSEDKMDKGFIHLKYKKLIYPIVKIPLIMSRHDEEIERGVPRLKGVGSVLMAVVAKVVGEMSKPQDPDEYMVLLIADHPKTGSYGNPDDFYLSIGLSPLDGEYQSLRKWYERESLPKIFYETEFGWTSKDMGAHLQRAKKEFQLKFVKNPSPAQLAVSENQRKNLPWIIIVEDSEVVKNNWWQRKILPLKLHDQFNFYVVRSVAESKEFFEASGGFFIAKTAMVIIDTNLGKGTSVAHGPELVRYFQDPRFKGIPVIAVSGVIREAKDLYKELYREKGLKIQETPIMKLLSEFPKGELPPLVFKDDLMRRLPDVIAKYARKIGEGDVARNIDWRKIENYWNAQEQRPEEVKKAVALLTNSPKTFLEFLGGGAKRARDIAVHNPHMAVISTDIFNMNDEHYYPVALSWREGDLESQKNQPPNLAILKGSIQEMIELLPDSSLNYILLENPDEYTWQLIKENLSLLKGKLKPGGMFIVKPFMTAHLLQMMTDKMSETFDYWTNETTPGIDFSKVFSPWESGKPTMFMKRDAAMAKVTGQANEAMMAEWGQLKKQFPALAETSWQMLPVATKEIIGDRSKRTGLIRMIQVSGHTAKSLLIDALPECKKALGKKMFNDKWDDLVMMSETEGVGTAFLILHLGGNDLKKWDGLLAIERSTDPNGDGRHHGGGHLFQEGFEFAKLKLGDHIYDDDWNELVRMAQEAKPYASHLIDEIFTSHFMTADLNNDINRFRRMGWAMVKEIKADKQGVTRKFFTENDDTITQVFMEDSIKESQSANAFDEGAYRRIKKGKWDSLCKITNQIEPRGRYAIVAYGFRMGSFMIHDEKGIMEAAKMLVAFVKEVGDQKAAILLKRGYEKIQNSRGTIYIATKEKLLRYLQSLKRMKISPNDFAMSEEERIFTGQTAIELNNRGGIDLTPANMHLQTQNPGEEIKFHMDPAMLQELQNAPGFVPVIIDVQPMTDLRKFLGISLTNQG